MARNLVNLENARKAFGTRILLAGVSLGVGERERIGVVGRNGGGKTTLLRVLAGEEPVDAGRVTRAGGLALGLLAQHDDLDPAATVRHVVVGDLADHEWAGEARVRDVLVGLFGGLGLPGLPAGLDSPIGPLSGGERRRVALARLLIGEQELLVLDEPTNHLDVEGVAWLAAHLRTRRSALVVVTHDRWFLDEVCGSTWEVVDGNVHAYDGGYSAYVLARAERDRIAATEEGRRQNLMRKELAWLRRGPPARTSKPRFRIDAANALIADEPPARDSVGLVSFAARRLGRTVYDVQDAALAIGKRMLLERLTWSVGPGERIGIVGVNGAGKTSLLRMLLGELAPRSGRVVTGVTVHAGYLSQQVSELDPSLRVLEAVEAVRRVVDLGAGRTMTASQLCDRLGFTGDAQWTPVGELSGGERRRLQLLRLLMDEPNVLLLDEPTNDLDIDTLLALEDLLDGWAGTLLVVSHDRYFLERVCDTTVALLGDGQLRDLPRGVEEYLQRRRELLASPAPVAARPAAPASPADAGSPRGSAARGSVPPGGAPPGSLASGTGSSPAIVAPDAAAVRQARKQLTRLERALERLGAEEADLHARMAASASDYAEVGALDERLRAVGVEREGLEHQWLELAERLPPG